MLGFIDKSLKYEYEFILCKPNRDEITVLEDIYDIKYSAKFPSTDELEFTIPYYISDNHRKVKNPIWNLIKGDYLILMRKKIGDKLIDSKYFLVDTPKENGSDKEVKNIHCYSLEYELNRKIIRNYNLPSRKLYSLTNETDSDGYQMGVLNYITTLTAWSIGDIDTDLLLKFRGFSISEQTVLGFLMNEVQKSYGCIFIFDTINRKIHARKIESIGINRGLYISEENYIKSINKEIKHDDIVTRLYCYGKDNLSINSLSPTGVSYIEDFSYYKTTEYMSQGLINALNNYDSLLNTKTTEFQGYLTQLKNLNTQLTTKHTELFTLETQLEIILDSIDTAIRAGHSYSDLNTQKANKQSQINTKKNEINSIKAQIDNVSINIGNLRNVIRKENNFTTSQLIELDYYVREKTWSDSNYENPQDLLDEAKNMMFRLNQPPIQFSIDVVDLLGIVECQHDWDKLVLGDILNIEYSNFNIDVQVRLIGYSHEIDKNNLTLQFSNKNKLDDPFIYLAELQRNLATTSTTLDMSRFKWDKSEDNNNLIKQILDNAWDSSKNAVLAGKNQEVVINERGISLSDTENPAEQLRMINNVIAMTQNNWNTASLAITPRGIFAEQLIGQILAGQNLLIKNSNNTFTVDGNGVTINGGALTITGGLPPSQLDPTFKDSLVELNKNYTNGIRIDTANGIIVTRSDDRIRTLLNATDGIKIQTKSDNNWADVLSFDSNGDGYMKGILDAKDIKLNGMSILNNMMIKGQHIESLSVDKLVTGTAKISTAMIENLVVGTNVTMGANATISWSQVSNKPTILGSTDVTTITNNTISTTNVIAQNLITRKLQTGEVRNSYRVEIDSRGIKSYNLDDQLHGICQDGFFSSLDFYRNGVKGLSISSGNSFAKFTHNNIDFLHKDDFLDYIYARGNWKFTGLIDLTTATVSGLTVRFA